ncbi:TraR/DksA family transcriptional regulator [Aurantivibrio infirmus]
MNSNQTDELKILLEKLRTQLVETKNADQQSTDIVKLDQTSVGRLSRMDALQSQAMALETARRNQQQLKKIQAALKRINEDEYGYCLTCGDEINIKRLQYNPAAENCIACAEAQES